MSKLELIETWTRTFGMSLYPAPPWLDTYGDGIRAAKIQVMRLLQATDDASIEPEVAPIIAPLTRANAKIAALNDRIKSLELALHGIDDDDRFDDVLHQTILKRTIMVTQIQEIMGNGCREDLWVPGETMIEAIQRMVQERDD
mgnify:CR=1 FL=1